MNQLLISKVKESLEYCDGHYVIPLPSRESNVMMPNNKDQAKRAIWQRNDYVNSVNDVIAKGYVRKVPVFLKQNVEKCGTYHIILYVTQRKPGKFASFLTVVQGIKVHR